MPSKKKTIEIIETFKNYILSNDSIIDDSDDEPIEAVKPNIKSNIPIKQVNQKQEQVNQNQKQEQVKEPVNQKQESEAVIKKKRIQTEAQKLNTLKMRDKLMEAQQRKKQEKTELKAIEQEQLNEKIIKKAISIKKKQIKKEKVLDEVSDDDTPMEEIVKNIKPKIKQMTLPPAPLVTNPKFTLKFHK